MNPFRFFLVVTGPTALMVDVALAILAFGAYLDWTSPHLFDQVLGITLFLQLFASSTGYRDRLRRGHFDAVLTGRSERLLIALAHWSVSVGLGFVVALLLGLIDVAHRPGHWPTPLSAAFLVATLYASTVVWTASLVLGRYAGALVWLVLLFTMAATERLQGLRIVFSAAPETWSSFLQSASGALICPIFLLVDPRAVSGSLLSTVLCGAILAWSIGAGLIAGFILDA